MAGSRKNCERPAGRYEETGTSTMSSRAAKAAHHLDRDDAAGADQRRVDDQLAAEQAVVAVRIADAQVEEQPNGVVVGAPGAAGTTRHRGRSSSPARRRCRHALRIWSSRCEASY